MYIKVAGFSNVHEVRALLLRVLLAVLVIFATRYQKLKEISSGGGCRIFQKGTCKTII